MTAKAKPSAKATAKPVKAPTAAKLAKASDDIPAGMKQLSGNFAPSWNPEEVPILHGTYSEPKSVTLTQGNKKVERRCVEFTTDTGEKYTVWESAGLAQMFETVEAGTPVYIRFDGLGVARKGQNAPKLFTVAIQE